MRRARALTSFHMQRINHESLNMRGVDWSSNGTVRTSEFSGRARRARWSCSLLAALALPACTPVPEITQFDVSPRLFCPGTDVVVSWSATDADSVELSHDGAVIAGGISGTHTLRAVAESGVLGLVARNSENFAALEQPVVAFTGHHVAHLVTAGL